MRPSDYPFTVQPLSEEEGGGYLIEFPDLPGCISDGETPEEAIRNGTDAAQCWIEAMREAGRPIPKPSLSVSKRSIGVPDFLYDLLINQAEEQGLDVETIAAAYLVSGIERSRRADKDDSHPSLFERVIKSLGSKDKSGRRPTRRRAPANESTR